MGEVAADHDERDIGMVSIDRVESPRKARSRIERIEHLATRHQMRICQNGKFHEPCSSPLLRISWLPKKGDTAPASFETLAMRAPQNEEFQK